MNKNLAMADRAVRITAALLIFVLIIAGTLTGLTAIIFGILAAVLFVTGTVAFCPLYYVLGLSSLKKTENKQ